MMSKVIAQNLISDLVMAYQREWTVVRLSFFDWAVKERIPPNVEEHAVDPIPLTALIRI